MKIANKRGQIAIWVIVALIIVVGIIILVSIKLKPSSQTSGDLSPTAFMQKCIRDSVLDATEQMMPQGGFVNPGNYKIYKNTKIEYLCENIGNYKPCVNQHPSFFNEEKEEIKNYIEPKINICFDNLKAEREKKNEEIRYGGGNLSVSLAPGKIIVNLNRETIITFNGETSTFRKYDVEIQNPLYDLINIANDIASNEAKYCYFEYVGYMILYPKYDIRKFTMSDSTKIYTIEDKDTGKKFNIATRSCAIPPGI